ncbi:hypothetical protein ACR75C_11290 [Thomasclavelia ramosa]|uniref:hypothetical protein n=1 Tax=Thomasclavelia ramosa TaxID=1547 RepID=UPI003DA5F161
MDKIELLFQHYNDTFSIQKENLANRNRYFVFLFITMCIQFLFALSPDSISTIIVSLIKESYKVNLSSQINIIQSALWIVLFYLTMRYFQTNIYIERQYTYIAYLESDLSKISHLKIDRENKSYLTNYPKICDFIDFIYKWFFPVFYIIILSIKLISEYVYHLSCAFHIFNTSIYILCIILDLLYLNFLHSKKNGK